MNMNIDQAVSHVERILSRWAQIRSEDPSITQAVTLERWGTDELRLAEVDFAWYQAGDPNALPRGGAAYMQVDRYGLMVCAAVERWVALLTMDDPGEVRWARTFVSDLLTEDMTETGNR